MTANDPDLSVTDAQQRFLDQSDFDLDAEFHQWLDDERIAHAAGICAECGTVVYTGGHTVVNAASPLGKTLGLSHNHTIDLCPQHAAIAHDAEQDTDAAPPALMYLHDYWGDYYLYRAERDAVADAPAGDGLVNQLIVDRDRLDQTARAERLGDWMYGLDLEVKYYNESVDEEAMAAAINTAINSQS